MTRIAEASGTSPRIAAAEALATERHAGQWRKGLNGVPYVAHCQEVAAIVAAHGGSEAAIAAGWLHDAVEDTPTTLAEIAERFGAEAAAIVAEVTDDPRLTTAGARAEQIRSAPFKSPAAALVKAADQTSNMCGIAGAPPFWPRERRLAYIAKARAVVAGLKIPEALRTEFETAADAAEHVAD